MPRKMMITAVCALLLMMSLAACGPKRDSSAVKQQTSSQNGDKAKQNSNSNKAQNGMPEKPDQLTVWSDSNPKLLAAIKNLTKKYTKKTGIKVKITPVAMNKQPQKLSLAGPSGNGPDLFYQPGVGALPVEGLVQPMQVSDEVRNRFLPESLKALSYKGKLYGLPFVIETYALFYNKKLIKKPPETIADMEKIAAKRTDKSKKEYGFLFDATNFYYAWAFMGGYGGYIFKPKGNSFDVHNIGLNKGGSVKGVKLIQSWFQKGYLPQGVNLDIAEGLFTQGKNAMVIDGPWATESLKKQLGDNLAVAPLPKLANGKRPQSFIGIKGWMLSKYAKHPKWATNLAEYLTNAKSTLAYYKQTGEIPPLTKVFNNPLLKNNELVSGFTEQMKYGIPFPNVPQLDAVWDPMADALKFAAKGDDVQKVLDEAVKKIKQKMKMAGSK